MTAVDDWSNRRLLIRESSLKSIPEAHGGASRSQQLITAFDRFLRIPNAFNKSRLIGMVDLPNRDEWEPAGFSAFDARLWNRWGFTVEHVAKFRGSIFEHRADHVVATCVYAYMKETDLWHPEEMNLSDIHSGIDKMVSAVKMLEVTQGISPLPSAHYSQNTQLATYVRWMTSRLKVFRDVTGNDTLEAHDSWLVSMTSDIRDRMLEKPQVIQFLHELNLLLGRSGRRSDTDEVLGNLSIFIREQFQGSLLLGYPNDLSALTEILPKVDDLSIIERMHILWQSVPDDRSIHAAGSTIRTIWNDEVAMEAIRDREIPLSWFTSWAEQYGSTMKAT